MRLLIFHVDAFTCTITEKGRSAVVEPPHPASGHIENGLLVLAAAEAGDEGHSGEVASDTAAEVAKLARQLKVGEVMLLPFAHLFVEPAPARDAIAIMDAAAERLRGSGLEVQRAPFGWFTSWELKAKGHPLSRVARTIRPPSPQPSPRGRGGRA